jgi:hypothetical protein
MILQALIGNKELVVADEANIGKLATLIELDTVGVYRYDGQKN